MALTAMWYPLTSKCWASIAVRTNTFVSLLLSLSLSHDCRYDADVVDPALKRQMGSAFHATHDVFDVLVTDGRYKLKTILDPACYRLVDTRALRAHSILQARHMWRHAAVGTRRCCSYDIC